jgi:hypothetical protein
MAGEEIGLAVIMKIEESFREPKKLGKGLTAKRPGGWSLSKARPSDTPRREAAIQAKGKEELLFELVGYLKLGAHIRVQWGR